MLSFKPSDVSVPHLHAFLQAGVAPRPIAFASTVDRTVRRTCRRSVFFNIFGSNPPIAIFSPARRVRGNTIKHTAGKRAEVPEVVINIVNYAMVQQTSPAGTEYGKGVKRVRKIGFYAHSFETVRPARVKESPMQSECVVKQVIETGTEGGAGNLIVCEIRMVHVREDVLDEHGQIDQHKIDLVARLGGNWYVRASGDALFEVTKPLTTVGIGVDALPEKIRRSGILTGNDLGRLGNTEERADGGRDQRVHPIRFGRRHLQGIRLFLWRMATRSHEIAHKLPGKRAGGRGLEIVVGNPSRYDTDAIRLWDTRHRSLR